MNPFPLFGAGIDYPLLYEIEIRDYDDDDSGPTYPEDPEAPDRWIGVVAEAVILIPKSNGQRPYAIMQEIQSAGIWGIAGDDSDAYLRQKAEEQFTDLADTLGKLGIKGLPAFADLVNQPQKRYRYGAPRMALRWESDHVMRGPGYRTKTIMSPNRKAEGG